MGRCLGNCPTGAIASEVRAVSSGCYCSLHLGELRHSPRIRHVDRLVVHDTLPFEPVYPFFPVVNIRTSRAR